MNADDFGLTPGVNRAIVELHAAGALPSATLMATGRAFADAVRLAREYPTLGVGCHIVLTDGVPVLPPSSIPTLVGSDGRSFRPSLTKFIAALLLGRIRADEITREAEAQIRRLQQAGVPVTHVDTHKHTHILPPVARPLLLAAERTGIRAIRNPFEPAWSLRIGEAGLLRRFQVLAAGQLRRSFFAQPALREGRIRTTEGTIGISATGHLNRATLRDLLEALPEGTWELVCHPGYNDRDLDAITTRLRSTREIERDALLEAVPREPPTQLNPEASSVRSQWINFAQL